MKIPSTLGFIYTPDLQYVLLILKQKPTFHAGKLNGLGGKSEGSETAQECLSREVQEESTLKIEPSDWKTMGSLSWQEWQVQIFATIYEGSIEDIASLGSEKVGWYEVKDLPSHILSNLQWLVPLGVDVLSNQTPPFVEVSY